VIDMGIIVKAANTEIEMGVTEMADDKEEMDGRVIGQQGHK
jgi:hypothetical protein